MNSPTAGEQVTGGNHRREDYLLRPIQEADLDTVLAWRNSERIRAFMYTDHLITLEEHRAWFKRLQEEKRSVFLILEYKARSVAAVSFTELDTKNARGEWGFYLGEKDLPKGTGTVLGVLGLEHAFENLNLRKLCGTAFMMNSASVRFFQRLGFSEEGRFVQHALKNGNYEDVVCFALFKDEWRNDRGRLEELAFHEH